MAAHRKGANIRAKPKTSRSDRAGLVFPVGRIHRQLRKRKDTKRVVAGVPVFLAAVLEYLTAEILEVAGIAAKEKNQTRITPRHIIMGIKNDIELDEMLEGITIAEGGVISRIHRFLLPKNNTKKSSRRS